MNNLLSSFTLMLAKIYPALQKSVLMASLPLASSLSYLPTHPPTHFPHIFCFLEPGILSKFIEKSSYMYDFFQPIPIPRLGITNRK